MIRLFRTDFDVRSRGIEGEVGFRLLASGLVATLRNCIELVLGASASRIDSNSSLPLVPGAASPGMLYNSDDVN
jgi:hypothetical protein